MRGSTVSQVSGMQGCLVWRGCADERFHCQSDCPDTGSTVSQVSGMQRCLVWRGCTDERFHCQSGVRYAGMSGLESLIR